ncbi:gamma-glutamyltransferase [Micromonospora sp. DPT]|uniref:gamma-glutamyltransferase family protein n=1 Tax=Micromonospora sp. DPT TaxID=3142975 RepID=UPI00320973A0
MSAEWPAATRNAVLAGEHMAASSHPAVSAVGHRVLAEGGTAIDATVAMAAMSWLALPGQCGVGGDAFAVVREPDGSVWTINGSGYGPDGGDLEFYRTRGLSAIPLTGALAVAAPGAVTAIAALQARGATRSLPELWAPAIAAAERGLPCTRKNRADILEHEAQLRADEGARRTFLRNGRAPQVGERLAQPELADSLRLLAADPRALYTGELADRAVAALAAAGAPFSGDEWVASGVALEGEAIAGRYGDLVVHATPLPTPGWMVLQQAAVCDGMLSRLPWLSADAVGWLVGAARQAFRDRWERCGADTDAWQALLRPEAVADVRARLAAGRRPLATAGLTPDGDTTTTVAVDGDGRAVSFIHSLAFTFGARITIPGTGIVLNNRLGRGAYLVEGHPNQVRPRRRPLHTCHAWLVTDAGGALRHVGNTPGGDGQVQWNMQVLSHLIDHGLDPQEAVSAPRFTVFPGSDADVVGAPDELICESRLGERTLAALRAARHPVRVVGPWDAGGSALVVSVDERLGCLTGGADPRQDGVVLGG